VWATEKDIDLLVNSGVTLVHNASSNLRSKSGIAPVKRMLERGIHVGIGLDSHSLSADEDMLAEMRLIGFLHNIPGIEPTSPSVGQILRMATVNGARAALFSDHVGTLEKGKRADIILVNLERITEPYFDSELTNDPELGIVAVLINRGKAIDVDTVMVDGQIVLHNRQHTRIDKNKIVAELRKSLSSGAASGDAGLTRLAQELPPYVARFYHAWGEPEGKPYYVYNSD
jgi:5-methylthioadenosine/S-adenosylhomocysteine deaminase